ncbi:MAG: hypothetical protein PHN92_06380 [Geobacter sp.]|nr:hypothetical protein [Geobacter sp.]
MESGINPPGKLHQHLAFVEPVPAKVVGDNGYIKVTVSRLFAGGKGTVQKGLVNNEIRTRDFNLGKI